jgi:hypothetical protein
VQTRLGIGHVLNDGHDAATCGECLLAANDAANAQLERYKEHGPALVRACALAAVMIPGPAGQAIADLIAKVEGR